MRQKHGMTDSPIYWIWRSMLQRCFDKNHSSYRNYGGRGITVCKKWLLFKNFYKDMGQRPLGKTMDRINNNSHYKPSNCRWATYKEQALNTRWNVRLERNGENKTVSEWADILGVNAKAIYHRIDRGWNYKRIFVQPFRKPRYPLKFSLEEIEKIKSLYPSLSQQKIGDKFGISQSKVWHILNDSQFVIKSPTEKVF